MNKIHIANRNHWWYRWIRAINWFAFRYWWFVWFLFILGLLCYYFFCCPIAERSCYDDAFKNRIDRIETELNNCCDCNEFRLDDKEEAIDKEEKIVEIVDDSVQRPAEQNCRVHFAGTLISDHPVSQHISEIYVLDEFSEYVGSGFYPNNSIAFPKAVNSSFDGIAIDRGTRLIIYSKPNFQGEILVDILGPAIINNEQYRNDASLGDFIHQRFKEPLETNYPQSCRQWSSSNMNDWDKGSCKIFCSL